MNSRSTGLGQAVALTRIFEPIKIRNVTIPNRIVRAAHGTHLARHTFDEDSIAYHVALAKGGRGLKIIEAASVHTSSENLLFNDFEILVRYRLVEIAHGSLFVLPRVSAGFPPSRE